MEKVLTYQPKNLKSLSEWFTKNTNALSSAWIVIYKKDSGKQVTGLGDIIEEAICHGWIDSKTKTIDQERYGVYITPRKTGSKWTKTNKEIAQRMIIENRMTKGGMDAFASSG